MNLKELEELGTHAKAFAKCYTALVEALRAEGVPDEQARDDARHAAIAAALSPIERCPNCGQVWE